MSKKKTFNKPLQLILFIMGGVIFILIGILIKPSDNESILSQLVISLGEALIIGPALSWILDLPSMIDYFKKITVESLISKEYLSSLQRNQLVELRKECTAKIHLKDTDTVEKGLINMDENVCELLTQAYCERYRQNSNCHKEGAFFVKRHYIEEVIINPLNTRITFKDFPSTYFHLSEGQDVKDVCSITKLTIKIDDQPEVDLTAKVKFKSESNTHNETHYNTIISWVDENGAALSMDFNNSIVINKVVDVKTPDSDILFIKRVRMPTKSFKIDYSYTGNDLRLIGSCFGTLSYSNDGGMKIIQEDSYVSIESFDWLLPGNGIFIVKVPK